MAGDYAIPGQTAVAAGRLPYCFLSDPLPMPPDPGVVGLVVVPVELEPLVLPEAPLPASEPLRASRMHLSRSAPVRLTHLLASLPDAPDAAPAEPDALPEDELPAGGVAAGGVAEGEVVLLLPLPEPEDCENATPDRARSAAAVAAVRVFNIMERSPSKGG